MKAPHDGTDARDDVRLEVRESVGDLFRRTREGFREDLNLVAQTLKIRHPYLKAIEERRYADLPGPTYAVGFVRAYSEYLGLDPQEMVRRFKEEVEGVDKKQTLHFPTPTPESRVPGGALLLISVLLIGAAYGGWFYLSGGEQTEVAETVPPVPETLQKLVGEAPATTAASEPAAAPEPTMHSTSAPAETATASAGGEATLVPGPVQAEPLVEPMQPPRLSDTGLVPPETTPETDRAEASPATDDVEPDAVEPAPPATVSATEAVAAVPDNRPVRLEITPAPEAAEEERTPAVSDSGAPRITFDRVLAGGQAQTQAGAASTGLPAAPPVTVDTTPVDDGDALRIPDAPEATQIAALANVPKPQVYGSDNEDARVVLRARQDSWVQIRDDSDELLLTRVLRRGDEYRVPNREGLMLRTGNAGGIEILVDGAAMTPIGPVGAFRDDVPLNPEQLLGGGAQ